MHWSCRIWVTCIAVLTWVNLSKSECSFPSAYHSDWLAYRTSNHQSFIVQFTSTSVKQGFLGYYFDSQCQETRLVGDSLEFKKSESSDFSCSVTYLTLGSRAMLVQQVLTSDGDVPLDTCSKKARQQNNIAVYTKDPLEKGDCPFGEKRYQLTYELGDSEIHCKGQRSSVAVVKGNQITLNSCYQGANTYDRPLTSSLTCVDTVQGSSVGSSDQILILANENEAQTSFYCAKYSINSETKDISLSIYLSSTSHVSCLKSGDSGTSGQRHLKLTLKDQPTDLPVTLKTTAAAVDATTTKLADHVCANRGIFFPSVNDSCSYLVCGDSTELLVRMRCAPGTSVPDHYTPSVYNPCTQLDEYLCAPCSFSSQLISPHRWWTTTVKSAQFITTFSNYKISNSLQTNGMNTPLVSKSCISSISLHKTTYHSRTNDHEKTPSSTECSQEVSVSDKGIVFSRHFVTALNTTPSECLEKFKGRPPIFSVMALLPLTTSLAGEECPFLETAYKMTFESALDEDGDDQCDISTVPVAEIQGQVLTFKGCPIYKGQNTTSRPLSLTLNCLASFPGRTLGIAEVADAQNVLLLRNAQDPGRFHCARYEVLSNGDITLEFFTMENREGTIEFRCDLSVSGSGDGADGAGGGASGARQERLITLVKSSRAGVLSATTLPTPGPVSATTLPSAVTTFPTLASSDGTGPTTLPSASSTEGPPVVTVNPASSSTTVTTTTTNAATTFPSTTTATTTTTPATTTSTTVQPASSTTLPTQSTTLPGALTTTKETKLITIPTTLSTTTLPGVPTTTTAATTATTTTASATTTAQTTTTTAATTTETTTTDATTTTITTTTAATTTATTTTATTTATTTDATTSDTVTTAVTTTPSTTTIPEVTTFADVSTQATTNATTDSGQPMTTTPLDTANYAQYSNSSAEAEIVFLNSFAQLVKGVEPEFAEKLKQQLAAALGISMDRLSNITLTSSSIRVTFHIREARNSSEISTQQILIRLRTLIANDTFVFKDLNNSKLDLKNDWNKVWTGDRPCPLYPCVNGGRCFVISLKAVCVCPVGRSGSRCTWQSRSTKSSNLTSVLIAVCSAAALIFLVVAVALVCCAYAKRYSGKTHASPCSSPFATTTNTTTTTAAGSDNCVDTPFAFSGQAKAYSARSTFTTTIPSHYA